MTKNTRAAQSQIITDHAVKNVEKLGVTLGEQTNILKELHAMAIELLPNYESASPPANLPPEHEQELNNTLRDIDAITQSLKSGQNHTGIKVRKPKNMV